MSFNKFFSAAVSAVIFTAMLPAAHAGWSLDNDSSQLNFVSVKADKVAEVHTFKTLSGKVDDAGYVEIAIDLTSVDTNIAIRDERMKEFLFETERFAVAVLTAQVDADAVAELAVGSTQALSVEGELTLHGQSEPVTLALNVVRLSDSELLAISSQPVIINAGSFDLADGVEKLREIAGLPSISTAVPVTFSLTFKR